MIYSGVLQVILIRRNVVTCLKFANALWQNSFFNKLNLFLKVNLSIHIYEVQVFITGHSRENKPTFHYPQGFCGK